jgi:hypothetical protein
LEFDLRVQEKKNPNGDEYVKVAMLADQEDCDWV